MTEIPKGSMSTSQAASIAGLTQSPIARACQTGAIKAVQVGPHNTWRIMPEDLKAWMDAREGARLLAGISASSSKKVASKRKCHDCGKPTNDYRCAACWEIKRRRLGLNINDDGYGVD